MQITICLGLLCHITSHHITWPSPSADPLSSHDMGSETNMSMRAAVGRRSERDVVPTTRDDQDGMAKL